MSGMSLTHLRSKQSDYDKFDWWKQFVEISSEHCINKHVKCYWKKQPLQTKNTADIFWGQKKSVSGNLAKRCHMWSMIFQRMLAKCYTEIFLVCFWFRSPFFFFVFLCCLIWSISYFCFSFFSWTALTKYNDCHFTVLHVHVNIKFAHHSLQRSWNKLFF